MQVYLRLLVVALFVCYINAATAQNGDSYLILGKLEFRKEYDSADYTKAVNYLTKAVELKPKNAEAHYYLAYALDRSVSKSGEFMLAANTQNTLKTSYHLEEAIKLSPKFKGELVVLDPYAKLHAIWGSLALKYEHDGKLDSAKWAMAEGKRRGGYRTYFIEQARLLLDMCTPDAILVTSGDNVFFPLKYLQLAEGYRTDVSVVDGGLMHSIWYPRMLLEKKIVPFDMPIEELDSITYHEWLPTEIIIPFGNSGKKVSWILKPAYMEYYLLRGNFVVLRMLKANAFKRDVFITAQPVEDRLSLDDNAQFLALLSQVVPKLENHTIPPQLFKAISLSKIDHNSTDEEKMVVAIRYNALMLAYWLAKEDQVKEARRIVNEVNKNIPAKKFPLDEGDRALIDELKKML
jgi:hypothetical protein